jgi:preprotein translocase subunit YajC
MHDTNTEKINRQAGMWTLLLCFSGVLVGFCVFMYTSQRTIEKAVTSMDKVVTEALAIQQTTLTGVVDQVDRHRLRIVENSHAIEDHTHKIITIEKRVNDLERGK